MRRLAYVLPLFLIFTSCADRGLNSGGGAASAQVALEAYCPVCYFEANKAVKGSPEFSAQHKGLTYYFNSEKSRSTFQQDPEKYLPQYDGWCAYGVALGRKIPVDPAVFSVVDGKLYLNKNRWVGRSFDKNPQKFIRKADDEWGALSASH